MDEKQTAALREVFEAAYVRHMNSPEIASTWGQRDYTFEEIAAMREGDFYNVGVAGVGQYHGYLNGCWWGFLACYQHLAPQLKDAARYQWLRDIDNEQEAFSAIHEFADKFLDQAIDAAIDRKKDAAREQEKKTC